MTVCNAFNRVDTGRRKSTAAGALALLALSVLWGCAPMPVTDPDGPARIVREERGTENDATEPGSAEGLRQQARQALASGDFDAALYAYVQAVGIDPTDTASLYAVGAIHERKGNAGLAARAYAKVVELDPTHALAQQGLGVVRFQAQEFEAARVALREAVRLDNRLWRSHNLLGVIADLDERYDDAAEHYAVAMELQPTLASVASNRGYSSYLAGDLETAEKYFLQAIEIDAEYEKAWKNLGLLYARKGRYEEARNMLLRVVSPHVAANDVGYVAMLGGDYEVAARLFEEAITTSPRYYPAAAENQTELSRRRSRELLVIEQ